MSNSQLLDRAEDLDVRRAMDGKTGSRKRNSNYADAGSSDSESERSEYDDLDNAVGNSALMDAIPVVDFSAGGFTAEKPSQSAVGGALKRNSDGTLLAPRVVKKKEKGQKVVVICISISLVA